MGCVRNKFLLGISSIHQVRVRDYFLTLIFTLAALKQVKGEFGLTRKALEGQFA